MRGIEVSIDEPRHPWPVDAARETRSTAAVMGLGRIVLRVPEPREDRGWSASGTGACS
jgi:hypothetical protein